MLFLTSRWDQVSVWQYARVFSSIYWLAPLSETFPSSPDISNRQIFSASLSTDDVVGVSQSQQSLSRSSTLPYDHIPQRAQPQHSLKTKARPHSPGSEMVTLEEFLQESNLKSPLMVIYIYIHLYYKFDLGAIETTLAKFFLSIMYLPVSESVERNNEWCGNI